MQKLIVVSGLPRAGKSLVAEGIAREHLKLGQSVVIDAVSAVEAARNVWREVGRPRTMHGSLSLKWSVAMSRLTENGSRNGCVTSAGMPEVTWERVQERRREFEARQDDHLTLDSIETLETLVDKALTYVQAGDA